MKGIEQFLQVDAATLGALKYAGTWNASTNTPTLASGVGVQGQYYVVSVAGSTNLDGETNWQVGDWAVFNGSVWQKVDGGSTSLLTTLTVTGNTYLATTSGDVGIGTSSPAAKLDVVGSLGIRVNEDGAGTKVIQIRSNYAGLGPSVQVSTADPLLFLTSNAEQMRITSVGDVGIGTTTPAVKLDVANGFIAVGANSANPGVGGNIRFRDDTGASRWLNGLLGGAGATAYSIYDLVAGAERLTINSTGDVGIGTSNPSAPLTVYKGAAGADVAYLLNGSGFGLRVQPQTGGGGTNTLAYVSSGESLSLGTNNTERMRIDSSGNLGIGTSSPAYTLDVRTSASNAIRVGSSSNAFGSLLSWDNPSGESRLMSIGAYSLVFGTNTTERMRIDSSGNLGLGVTPSAASLPTIQSAYGLFTGNVEAHISKNAYYNSGWKYAITAPAARYSVGEGDSGYRWYQAGSGTAGDAISFTQAMTLDASGNLGVGTSSPSGYGVIVAKKDQTADTAISVSNQGTANAATSMSFTLNEAGTPQGWLRRYRDGTGNTEVGFSGALLFTGNVTGTKTERARIDSSGNLLVGTTSGNGGSGGLKVNGQLALASSQGVTTSATVNDSAYYIVCYSLSGTCTLTLPTPASHPGRLLNIVVQSAQQVVSASSNVAKITDGSLTTDILPATAGKWAQLWCDGTYWNIIATNV